MSPDFAQKLVDKIMNTVPQNINIIDENGIIIASGERKRIGTLHQAAMSAIKNNRIEFVTKPEKGMLPGINLPFFFQGQICGVVGISGIAEDSLTLANLVRYTVELLIEQEVHVSSNQAVALTHNIFLHEWVLRSLPPDEDFIERGRKYNIVIPSRTIVCAVSCPKESNSSQSIQKRLHDILHREGSESYLFGMQEDLLVILLSKEIQTETLAAIISQYPSIRIGISQSEAIAKHSYKQAISALSIGSLLHPDDSICCYSSYMCFDMMNYGASSLGIKVPFSEIFQDENAPLLQTLFSLFRNNGEYNITAHNLHIHRNTLNYRLEKIHSMTGRDPKNYLDLLDLICKYIIIHLHQE
jgi:carbohydrate diacid regulator